MEEIVKEGRTFLCLQDGRGCADFTAIDLKAGGFCLMELKDARGDEVCEITTTQDRRGVWWHTNFVARLEGPLDSDRRCLPSSHFAGSCCKDKFCPHPKPNLGGRMNPFLTSRKSMPHLVKALQSLVNTVVVDYSKLWFKQTDDLEWYCLLCMLSVNDRSIKRARLRGM